jgi:hypothetical protein
LALHVAFQIWAASAAGRSGHERVAVLLAALGAAVLPAGSVEAI